jgi:peroxin-11A/peroxin-11B
MDMLQGAFRNLSVKDTALRLLVVSVRLTRVLYFLVDQVVWATRLGLYKADPKAWSKFQAKIWSIALILCVTRNMYDIYNLIKTTDKKNEDPGTQTVCWYEKFKTRPEVLVDTVKNCADFLIPLNIIGVIEINNGIVGVLGLISSLAGASTVWEPMLKLKP